MITKVLRDDWNTGPARTETPLRSAVELAVAETAEARHQRRQRIRDKLAAEETANWQHNQACNDLAEWEEKRSQISIAHRETVEPLEVELGEIERQQIQSRKDESLADRRGELLDQIRAGKADRDRQLASYEREWERLETLRIAAAKRVPTGKRVTEQDLFDDGDKTLLAKFALAKHDCASAIARLDLLQDKHLNTPPEDIAEALELVEVTSMVRRKCFENVINE